MVGRPVRRRLRSGSDRNPLLDRSTCLAATIDAEQPDRCLATLCAELLEQEADVSADSHLRHAEPVRDLAGGEPFGQRFSHFPLTRSEGHRATGQHEPAFRAAPNLRYQIRHERP